MLTVRVVRGLFLRSGIAFITATPAAMHPQPLVGVLAHDFSISLMTQRVPCRIASSRERVLALSPELYQHDAG
jgi:hypothetical protein